MAITDFRNIITGGTRTKRLAADTTYIADGSDEKPYIIAFQAPDTSTIFSICNNKDGNSVIDTMGLGVSLLNAAPVEYFSQPIKEIRANSAIVLILLDNVIR